MTIWVLGMVPVMFMCLGLVVDGGRAISAHADAVGVADSAARIAVDRLDTRGYRDGGGVRAVAPGAAQAAACGWVATARPDASCSASIGAGGAVTVTVTLSYAPVVLSAIGVGGLTQTGTATARPAIGDRTEIDTPGTPFIRRRHIVRCAAASGSCLATVAWRVPRGISLLSRSICPQCGRRSGSHM